MSNLEKTPLHPVHIEAGARMGPFAGFDMPIQYEGILAEHHHTRTKVSIFDTCHMGEFDLRGPTALADLENLLTLKVGTLNIGQCRYGFLLNDAGGVIDDLTCYRRAEDHFFLVVNAGTRGGDAGWIASKLSPGTAFTDLSPGRAKIDVQGPASRAAIEKVFGQTLPELGYFRFTDVTLGGVDMTLSRTGYTGEWGYELYMDDTHGPDLWNKLVADGEIKPAGLGSRDTLRLEMGYALYGHELNDQMSPVAATRGMFIAKDKDFIGKATVDHDLADCQRYLTPILLESKRAAREGDDVVKDGTVIGTVTSGSIAPSIERAVALAYVDAAHTGIGTSLAISVRGKELAGEVTDLPFYKNGTARG